MAESAREILKGMSLANRKFSMNRNTGTPRVSTKAARRFSTHDPSANGMYLLFLCVVLWLIGVLFVLWRVWMGLLEVFENRRTKGR